MDAGVKQGKSARPQSPSGLAAPTLADDDLGRDVVEKRELARRLAPSALEQHRVTPAWVVCELADVSAWHRACGESAEVAVAGGCRR